MPLQIDVNFVCGTEPPEAGDEKPVLRPSEMDLGPSAGPERELWRCVIGAAAAAALGEHAITDAVLDISLLSDPAMAELNRRFLGHEGTTDVIAFALYQPGEEPVGDIYVGIEQAQRQAREHGVDLVEELARLAIHGTLHVLGHLHAGEAAEHSAMWLLQERILKQVCQR